MNIMNKCKKDNKYQIQTDYIKIRVINFNKLCKTLKKSFHHFIKMKVKK